MSKKTISSISANKCYALVIGIDYIKTPEIKLNDRKKMPSIFFLLNYKTIYIYQIRET